jgi:hypothetical protein
MWINDTNARRMAVVLALWWPLAVQGYESAGGTGEPNDPYQIATAEQLIAIGSDPNLLSKHFVLTADIDLDPNLPGGRVFDRAVIAPDVGEERGFQGTPFTGSFDGDGFKVLNLTIRGAGFLGLFGDVSSGGQVRNLWIPDANIVSERGDFVGSLAGTNEGSIVNCWANGTVAAPTYAGGLVGYNKTHGVVAGCTADVTLTTSLQPSGTSLTGYYQGGLVGYNQGDIVNSSASGDMTGDHFLGGLAGLNDGRILACRAQGHAVSRQAEWGVGGLVGFNTGAITDSYAVASVCSKTPVDCLGALVGRSSGRVTNCYAVGTVFNANTEDSHSGGLIGFCNVLSTGYVSDCFWDKDVSGISASKGGTGVTTGQMMDPEFYSLNGWGGDPNWVLDASHDYPRLAWEGTRGDPIPAPVIDWLTGNGTPDDPYIIANAEQLARTGTASVLWDKAFILAADVDLTGMNVSPIGRFAGNDFQGTFDGGHHVVDNLTIDTGEAPGWLVGLFGRVGLRGSISNLSLRTATVQAGLESEGVGILAGYSVGTVTMCSTSGIVCAKERSSGIGGMIGFDGGRILNCTSTADVSGARESYGLGGLAGISYGHISHCRAGGSIYGGDSSTSLGGLVGHLGVQTGIITGCYASGGVSAADGSRCLGGLVGYSASDIDNCYATGCITGLGSEYLGGFVGEKRSGTIANCYAVGQVLADEGDLTGGLVGHDSIPWGWSSITTACFWDVEASGVTQSEGGTGLTTVQMQATGTFLDAGWDFDATWMICEGKGYPHLQWENVRCE